MNTYPRYELVYVNYGPAAPDEPSNGGDFIQGHFLKIENNFEDDPTEEYIERDMFVSVEDANRMFSDEIRYSRKVMTDDEWIAYSEDRR